MSVTDFSEMIKNDPANYYDNEDDLLEGFRNIVYNIATPALPLIFKTIPEAEIM